MMSKPRFDALHTGLSAVAKKVYAAVPLADCWPLSKIAGEIVRNGSGVEYRILAGCLNTLKTNGLITEPHQGFFKREPVKAEKVEQKQAVEPKEEKATEMKQTTTKQRTGALDRLGDLSQRVAVMANDLKALAGDIADATIDMQAEIEANAENLSKLKQLQSLLGSLTHTD